MATTSNTTAPAQPSTAVVITPTTAPSITTTVVTAGASGSNAVTTTLTYTKFNILSFEYMPMQNAVKVKVAKTDNNNKVAIDVFNLSPTEMALLASYNATAGESFVAVWQTVVASIIKSNYNFA